MTESQQHVARKIPTIKDVARLAGVSTITVSRVQNHYPLVSEETRKKVLKIINEIGYKPNLAASSLSRRKSEAIAIVVEEEIFTLSNMEVASLTQSISKNLNKYGYHLVFDTIHFRASEEDLKKLSILQKNGVEGLIVRVINSLRDFQEALDKIAIPYILVNPTYHQINNAVMCDDARVGHDAADYLIKQGHRNIGYVPHAQQALHASRYDRFQGYCQAMVGAGLSRIHSEEFFPDKNSTAEGIYGPAYAECIKLYREKYGCTAVITYDAATAVAVWITCQELRLRVPQDISIISCDYDPILQIARYPLTCFQFDRMHMGKLAVEMLLQRIEHHTTVRSVWEQAQLKEGASVAPCPGA